MPKTSLVVQGEDVIRVQAPSPNSGQDKVGVKKPLSISIDKSSIELQRPTSSIGESDLDGQGHGGQLIKLDGGEDHLQALTQDKTTQHGTKWHQT